MHAKVTYLLSDVGRKASILSGGDGAAEQTILVPREAPEFARVVELGTVNSDGPQWRASYNPTGPDYYHDTMQTVGSLLDWYDTRMAAAAAKRAAEAEDCRVRTLAVLAAREVRTTIHSEPWGKYTTTEASWPYPADQSVIDSPESQTWLAEISAANAAAKTVCDALRPEYEARVAAEAEAAERAKAERKAARAAKCVELGGLETDLLLSVEDGALTMVPAGCWQSYSRGKNWLAVISVSPSSPGGLSRDFQTKARGDSYYYIASGLSVGDPVEFGADYYYGGGRKSPTRWYGFVVAKTDSHIVLRPIAGGESACKAAVKWMAERIPAPAPGAGA